VSKQEFSRRKFLSITGATGLSAALAGSLRPSGDPLDRVLRQAPGAPDGAVPTFCEVCFWKCGQLAQLREGKVIAITGNPDHPLSNGRLCGRGTAATGTLYDPDRLVKPLIREGRRGEDRFREASWEEALDRVAEGFMRVAEEHGPESIAMLYHGAGSSFFKTLLHGLGSPNMAAPSYAQCRGPREVGFELTFGEGVGSPEIIDVPRTHCLALLGSHIGENMHNTPVQDFAAALKRGMHLIVVDPRYSTAAGKSDWWLPIRPGTDMALILGWINLILREGWYDARFIERNAVGLEELKAEVAVYTPEAVYVETGIEPAMQRKTARALADAAPHALVHPGRRVTWYGDDAQRSRAIAILNALLGNWGREGGFYISSKARLAPYPDLPAFPEHREPADRKPGEHVFAGEQLASGLRDATLTGEPYPIRSWLVYGSNLPAVLPDPQKTYEAIQKLDFMVAIDILPAEICGWADVVLPECTYLERHDDLIAPWYKQPYVGIRQPVVPPIGDSQPGWWMAKELAGRMGLERYFPWKDPEELHEKRLLASGYDAEQIAELRRTGVILTQADPLYLPEDYQPEFNTPSGKIELYSQQLADQGFDPVPVYRRPPMPAPGSFRLITGRAPAHTFGRTINNRILLEQYRENDVWVNRTVAADLGLESGDQVTLRNQDGAETGPIRVRATERIRSDCVYMVHGFGQRASRLSLAHGLGGDDSTLTTRYETDPLMGGTGMNVNFVTLEKVEV